MKLIVDLSFFAWTTGSAGEFASSLFSGVLSVGTLVCRTPDGVPWVTQLFKEFLQAGMFIVVWRILLG